MECNSLSTPAEQPLVDSDTRTRKDGRSIAVLRDTDKRAQRNRALASDRVRQRLKVGRMLGNLRSIDEELAGINEAVKAARPVFDSTGAPVIDPHTGVQMVASNSLSEEEARAYAVRIKVLERRTDIQFKKLAKVLPDLSKVVVGDKDGNNPFAQLFAAIAHAASIDKMPSTQEPRDDAGG